MHSGKTGLFVFFLRSPPQNLILPNQGRHQIIRFSFYVICS